MLGLEGINLMVGNGGEYDGKEIFWLLELL